MNSIDRLTVKYHGEIVGVISLTPDDKRLAFEYDPRWLAEGFSISPLELPLKTGLFLAKPTPLYGDFGIFEDSLPDGYGRYLLHKALMREGIDDRNLTAIERLSIVGNSGMGSYHGKYGFDTFTHKKSVVFKPNFLDLPLRYQPYARWKDKIIRMFM